MKKYFRFTKQFINEVTTGKDRERFYGMEVDCAERAQFWFIKKLYAGSAFRGSTCR